MKKILIAGFMASLFLTSCNKDEQIIDAFNAYSSEKETTGYHLGEAIVLPKEITENAESISISFGDKETDKLIIDPNYFTLGDNGVTFNIHKKGGETLQLDAIINVFAKNPEQNIAYEIVKQYPHDPKSFTQGFQLEGNTIYESDGQQGESKLWKYNLGSTTPTVSTSQPAPLFSEGCAIVGDKVYQLTWQNKKIFKYNKSDLSLVAEYENPNLMLEGWGLTYDGNHLLASDGSKNIYFLNTSDPSKIVRYIGVAGHKSTFDQLNELEFYNGFLYANVWHQPIILKIDPKNGEVVGKMDFTEIAKKYTSKDSEHVLNGIAFKGDNMLVTGKNWDTIYEVAIK